MLFVIYVTDYNRYYRTSIIMKFFRKQICKYAMMDGGWQYAVDGRWVVISPYGFDLLWCRQSTSEMRYEAK